MKPIIASNNSGVGGSAAVHWTTEVFVSQEKVPSRGRGRPRKLPRDGKGLRLTVSEEEAEMIERARRVFGCSQNEFTRAAVLSFARSVILAHSQSQSDDAA